MGKHFFRFFGPYEAGSCIKPNKRYLPELLIYFFNLKKSAVEAHWSLVETLGKAVLSERSCRQWFQKLKNGEFDIEDKERSGRPKVYEDADLEALLDQDSCKQDKKRRKLICTLNTKNHGFNILTKPIFLTIIFLFIWLLLPWFNLLFQKPDEVGKPIANEMSLQCRNNEEFSSFYFTLIDREPTSFILMIIWTNLIRRLRKLNSGLPGNSICLFTLGFPWIVNRNRNKHVYNVPLF